MRLLRNIRAGYGTIELLYIEDLGEELEVGPGVRRFGALFVKHFGSRPELVPLQFLGTIEHTEDGMNVWPVGGLRIP